MEINLDLIIYLGSFLLFTTLIYGQGRINTKNTGWYKRLTLSLSGVFSKDVTEELIRVMYLSVVILAVMVFIYLSDGFIIGNILFSLSFSSLLSIVIGFIAFVQILFITVTIIYGVVLKKDISEVLKGIDWLKVDSRSFFYKGYVKILGVAVFEVAYFFNFIFNLLYQRLELTLFMSTFITVTYYCYSKFILRRGRDRNMILAILGLAISLPTLMLINTLNSLLIGVIFMYIILIMIAFKDIKVRF